jgi:hypothetical protein
MKKGILHTPYHEEAALNLMREAGFTVVKHYVKGYGLNVVLQKT